MEEMDEREQIIVIVFSIVAFLSLLIIISLSIGCFLRRKSRPIPRQQRYQRAQKLSTVNSKRRRRFNTNESAISYSFNPPHLINQNVKNLDQLFATESSLHYDEKTANNNFHCCYPNPVTEPVYVSSSSISTPILNLPSSFQTHPSQLNNLQSHLWYSEQNNRPSNPVKYSQSCRQTNDLIPFDYHRLITRNDNLLEPIHLRSSNATLMRKAQLAHLRDDTTILY